MSTDANKKTPQRRAKGEATKRLITVAAIEAVSDVGFEAATHRLIADKAGVRLALTTYYFNGLDELLIEAAGHYVREASIDHASAWATGVKLVNDLQSSGVPADKLSIELAQHCLDYIELALSGDQVGLRFEVNLLYAKHNISEVSDHAATFWAGLVASAEELTRLLGSRQPEIDARILIGTILRLEFESINKAVRPESNVMLAELTRVFDLMLGVRGR